MSYFFTSESVSEGHPDKVCDQISDAVLDFIIARDPDAKVACETYVTTGLVVVGGEIKTTSKVKSELDVNRIARDVIKRIGYDKSEYMFDACSCAVINVLHEQSDDINRGVDRKNKKKQGAGDQGMMFGYATNETDNYMPLALDLSHRLLRELASIRREKKIMKYLRPDSKAQVTIEYGDDNKPKRIDTIVLSTQHDEFDTDSAMQKRIRKDIIEYLIPRVKKQLSPRLQKLFDTKIRYHINPTGKFVIGGPHGDTGLTGRKIIVDTYGGKGAHGGGAFSGKDPSKVDRSAAYASRHLAKNIVASGLASECLIQVSYAIGVAEPVSIFVNTYGTGKITDSEIAEFIKKEIDMTPAGIIERLKLKRPIYSKTAAYGHFGKNDKDFTWEKLDLVKSFSRLF
ncbi:MAG: methionine adenosyltransferase [Ignavibacteria bacterium]|nr:methionine adenosyltransferase [Ignavibacteria bacterium]